MQTQNSTVPTEQPSTPRVEELRLDVAWEARHGITDLVGCRVCGRFLTSLYDHIPRHGWKIERYQSEYPGAPMWSVEYRKRQTQSEAARLKDDPVAKKKARERTIRWRNDQPEAYKAARVRSWAKPDTKRKSYANKKKNRELIRAKLVEAERILTQQGQQPPKKKRRPATLESDKNFFKIGKSVEMEIPSNLKDDKHAIVQARRTVSEATRLEYDVVAQYHKRFRASRHPV